MSHPIPTLEYELEEDLDITPVAPFVSDVRNEFGNVDEFRDARRTKIRPKLLEKPIVGRGLNVPRIMNHILFGEDAKFYVPERKD